MVYNPEMLSLARKSRGLTQSQLAQQSGVPQSRISKSEAGILSLAEPQMACIAESLDYPINFFSRSVTVEGPGLSETFHRKRQRTTIGNLTKIHAVAEVRRMEIIKLLESADDMRPDVPWLPIDEFEDDPAKIARMVRAYWNIPSGPIFNLTRTLEQHGCIVLAHDFGTRTVDGFSHRATATQGITPLFHINTALPPDRWRWTLAHELGHIVMHFEPDGIPRMTEQQANDFAGEFLAPAHELLPMLPGIALNQLAGLKREWKISMQAILMRAYRLGVITDRQRSAMFAQLTRAGYRTREPMELDPPIEVPERPYQLTRFYLTDLEYTPAEMREYLAIGERDYHTYYSRQDPLEKLWGDDD